jgi:DNA-binding FrmR family transcriptional regulator
MERPSDLGDRQLEAVLERLDKIGGELERLNRRLDERQDLAAIAHELKSLNESLSALAYAALGTQGPSVRRRRAS